MLKNFSLNLILLFLFSSTIQAETVLQIKQAWIPEAPPGASIMAGYMKIINNSQKELKILHISSPEFKKVEMHLSKDFNGIAKMLPQQNLLIPAKGSLELKAGSYHLMLIKPRKRLKQGDTVSLQLELSNRQKQSVEMNVEKAFQKKMMKCGAGKCGG